MPVGTSFRAFFAVPLEGPVARALEEAARARLGGPDAPGGTWRVTPAERIHVTLRFVGDAPREALPRLEEALRGAASGARPFPVEFGGWVPLPGPRDPRVLAVGVSDPTGTLSALTARLEARVASLGFPGEARGYLAHVTVARRKGAGKRRKVVETQRSAGVAGMTGGGGCVPPPASREGPAAAKPERLAAQTVGRVVLMESVLGPDGPTYAVVADVTL